MISECFCQILPENIFKRSSYWSSSLADKKHYFLLSNTALGTHITLSTCQKVTLDFLNKKQ